MKKQIIWFWGIVFFTLLFFYINIPFTKLNNFNLGGQYFSTKKLKGNYVKDLSLKEGLDIAGGVKVTMEPDLTGIDPEEQDEALISLKRIMEERINRFGVNEPLIVINKFNNTPRLTIEIPGISDLDRAIELVGRTAQIGFKFLDGTTEQEIEGLDQPIQLPNYKDTNLESKDIKKAAPEIYLGHSGQGQPSVKITFTNDGKKKFFNLTKNNVGKQLCILLDNVPLICPNISSAIPDGEAYITGGYTTQVAKDVAIQINSGALPVPVKIISQGLVGAKIGDNMVNKSIIGATLGLVMVSFFMLFNYGKLGVVSIFSLLVFILLNKKR